MSRTWVEREFRELRMVIGRQANKDNLHGECWVLDYRGDARWWAGCGVCRHVDLFKGIDLLTGTWCYECNRGNVGRTVDNSRMRALVSQEQACSAFLMGGVEAVEALAEYELDCLGGDL